MASKDRISFIFTPFWTKTFQMYLKASRSLIWQRFWQRDSNINITKSTLNAQFNFKNATQIYLFF